MMTKTRKRSGRILLDCSLIRFAVLPDNRRPEKLKAQKLDDQLGDADEEKDKAALEPDVDEGEVGGLRDDGVDFVAHGGHRDQVGEMDVVLGGDATSVGGEVHGDPGEEDEEE